MDDDLTPDCAPEVLLARMQKAHGLEKDVLARLDEHYEGEQPLSYMAPELVDELSDRIRQVVIGWPQLVADSAEERLDVEGFRLGGSPEADEDLEGIWEANDLPRLSQQAHLDAIVMRRAYVIGSARSDGDRSPLLTVESALEVAHERCPRTRRVRAAVKWWTEGEGKETVHHATLYLPNETSFWVRGEAGTWVIDRQHPADEHGMGLVPVVPIVNRPRLRTRPDRDGRRGEGVSDLSQVIPLSDAACKIATDMMVGAEFHAVPRRVAFGFGEKDFQDENGNRVSAFSRAIGRVWATELNTKDDGVDVKQFPESDLAGFHGTLKMLAQLTASISGLPPHYLGMTTENPASADAIRSSEARLVKRVERKQSQFGADWADVMRLALKIRDGVVPEDAVRLKTIWRDAATPTVAQRADAAVKLFSSGVVPKRQTREDLGYSPQQIDRMEDEDERDAALALGFTAPEKPEDGETEDGMPPAAGAPGDVPPADDAEPDDGEGD